MSPAPTRKPRTTARTTLTTRPPLNASFAAQVNFGRQPNLPPLRLGDVAGRQTPSGSGGAYRTGDSVREQWWHCVAELGLDAAAGADEVEGVGKGEQALQLAHAQTAGERQYIRQSGYTRIVL